MLVEIIAVLALILATASLTLQLSTKKQTEKQEAFIPFEQIPATEHEALTVFEARKGKPMPTPEELDKQFNEAFASSDAEYTGIGDDFGV